MDLNEFDYKLRLLAKVVWHLVLLLMLIGFVAYAIYTIIF